MNEAKKNEQFEMSAKEIELFEQSEKRKKELKSNIIDWLTDEPEVLEKELISGYFLITSLNSSDERASAFQRLWYIISDAKELKKLM